MHHPLLCDCQIIDEGGVRGIDAKASAGALAMETASSGRSSEAL